MSKNQVQESGSREKKGEQQPKERNSEKVIKSAEGLVNKYLQDIDNIEDDKPRYQKLLIEAGFISNEEIKNAYENANKLSDNIEENANKLSDNIEENTKETILASSKKFKEDEVLKNLYNKAKQNLDIKISDQINAFGELGEEGKTQYTDEQYKEDNKKLSELISLVNQRAALEMGVIQHDLPQKLNAVDGKLGAGALVTLRDASFQDDLKELGVTLIDNPDENKYHKIAILAGQIRGALSLINIGTTDDNMHTRLRNECLNLMRPNGPVSAGLGVILSGLYLNNEKQEGDLIKENLNVAKDLAMMTNEEHHHIVTIGKKIVVGEQVYNPLIMDLITDPITKETKAKLKKIKDWAINTNEENYKKLPKWFTSYDEVKQKLFIKSIDNLLDGNHMMSSQGRDNPGISNARLEHRGLIKQSVQDGGTEFKIDDNKNFKFSFGRGIWQPSDKPKGWRKWSAMVFSPLLFPLDFQIVRKGLRSVSPSFVYGTTVTREQINKAKDNLNKMIEDNPGKKINIVNVASSGFLTRFAAQDERVIHLATEAAIYELQKAMGKKAPKIVYKQASLNVSGLVKHGFRNLLRLPISPVILTINYFRTTKLPYVSFTSRANDIEDIATMMADPEAYTNLNCKSVKDRSQIAAEGCYAKIFEQKLLIELNTKHSCQYKYSNLDKEIKKLEENIEQSNRTIKAINNAANASNQYDEIERGIHEAQKQKAEKIVYDQLLLEELKSIKNFQNNYLDSSTGSRHGEFLAGGEGGTCGVNALKVGGVYKKIPIVGYSGLGPLSQFKPRLKNHLADYNKFKPSLHEGLIGEVATITSDIKKDVGPKDLATQVKDLPREASMKQGKSFNLNKRFHQEDKKFISPPISKSNNYKGRG